MVFYKFIAGGFISEDVVAMEELLLLPPLDLFSANQILSGESHPVFS